MVMVVVDSSSLQPDSMPPSDGLVGDSVAPPGTESAFIK